MYRLHMIASHLAAFSHLARTGKLLAAWNLLGHFKPHIVMLYCVNSHLNLKSAVFIVTSTTTLWTQRKWERKKQKQKACLFLSDIALLRQWDMLELEKCEQWPLSVRRKKDKKRARNREWERAETEHCVVKVEINTNTVERRRGSWDKVEHYLSSSFLLFPPSLCSLPRAAGVVGG